MSETNDLSRPPSNDTDAVYGSRADVEHGSADPGDSAAERGASPDTDAVRGSRADVEDRVAEAAADPADRRGDVFPTA